MGGVLLCGGRGLRMRGVEKGLLPLDGKPLCAHAAERLRRQVSWLAISANRERERYAAFGLPVLPDLRPGFWGPLAGVEAAWAALPPSLSFLLTAPGDSPFLPRDLGERLFRGVMAGTTGSAYAHDGVRGQFLCALYERESEGLLRGFLDRGGRRAEEFLQSIGATAIDFSERPADFWNVNSPEDWERIRQRAAEERKGR
ncbi:molybdenum cofactor guanylyltransferase MobA [Methylacidimicrobium sp. B4]|uniref:molybdenum cofactor guanylyltransferase MobA n=1 Tax=Methylacidimicrobium sp. B4 TaxID=2796139 RepID=UPI001A8C5D99|nr:molybdenum cofactor guanylyltransferase MobA [Methylacidimicrobium sp. B4]QSR85176.1 molybdenum cofactor guanylyltransferase [Methylacidimicrobium sp. B4]